MDWFNAEGTTMTIDDWNSPEERTLQYLAASTPEFEAFNRILLVVHAHEEPTEVVLPDARGRHRLYAAVGLRGRGTRRRPVRARTRRSDRGAAAVDAPVPRPRRRR